MSLFFDFSTRQLDLLKEIGNIGAGNAATALSNMLNKKIYMKVPDVKIGSFNEIIDIVGSEEEVVAIYFRLEGDISGSMFFVLSVKQAERYLKELLGSLSVFNKHEITEIETSALQELGNILMGSYVAALADLTKLLIHPSVPSLSFDMFGAIISHGFIELSQNSDRALIIDTVIKDDEQPEDDFLSGHIFFMPNVDVYKKIFEKLEVS
ncbi:chemotaxis protein CheC [Bacillus alveayuensis]|jgi:chemotaxis protein CheC|uniref:chemotaxis protein CheC n=1 Tax=Aeribacillus alveayuensis TaxID=279215 RepID=UPI0005CD9E2B|nr:chemotaxis protein CheC [Bacillus alveayuensis]